jgi:ATP-dependent protease HslVU (ClpYQ) peptidase subunit
MSDADFIREHEKAAVHARSLQRLEVMVAIAGRVRRVGIAKGTHDIVNAARTIVDIGADTLAKFRRLR